MKICVLKKECPNQFKVDKEDLNMVSYQNGYDEGYQQGRKDAFEDIRNKMEYRETYLSGYLTISEWMGE